MPFAGVHYVLQLIRKSGENVRPVPLSSSHKRGRLQRLGQIYWDWGSASGTIGENPAVGLRS
jgi:hypothetical protein